MQLQDDLIWYDILIPTAKNVNLAKIAEPVSGVPVGIRSSVNQVHSVGKVTSYDDVYVQHSCSTEVGHCGSPLVSEEGHIFGIHRADGQALYLKPYLEFFRAPRAKPQAIAKPSSTPSAKNKEARKAAHKVQPPPRPVVWVRSDKATAPKN